MQPIRRHKRYKVDVIEINGKMVLAKYVKILNISIGGISLQTEKRLNVGSQYTLKIEGKGKVITIKGMVVWSLLSESIGDTRGNIIPIYKAGMKFIDLSKEKSNEIAQFIEDHKLDIDKQVDLYCPDGLRLHVRIRIKNPEKAELKFHESYKVKKLSLGGMLIESEHALETESSLPMEMTLTEDKSIAFSGKVTSCLLMKKNNFEHYEIGINFLDISEKDRAILHDFLKLLDTMGMNSQSL